MNESTQRIATNKQSLDDAYSAPANYLEISVTDAKTYGEGRQRFTDYAISTKTNIPVFKIKESTVRRRYSDFKWLRDELERSVQITLPGLPGKALTRQIPFVKNDDGIFEIEFIEERKTGLEDFINKLAGHPLVQNEQCLHMFLLEPALDKRNYVPGKVPH
ncbi:sorting nexin-3 [Eurytemora carolleeae]|uniref:sorting nexin-3 n=1 Tax=Eurytemora carolleeae TaxID=1294199 RepID=UPI000C75626A|nr:sorting nexin-3 [Eurytemora carolleeae]|eukprot:XP_023328892.1 sorting nexin-3-like [Eurytemora affinis]